MRRFIVLAGVIAVAALVASGAGAITAPPVPFTDPSGDAGTAPDITAVTATNDDHGLYTITLKFATPYGDAAGAQVLFDIDQNASTGDPQSGAEYAFVDDHASHSYGLYHWSGSDWADTSDKTTGVSVAPDNMSVTFTVNKSELGNVSKFNFFVLSTDGDGSDGHYDIAPSGSDWFTYGAQTVFTLTAAAEREGAAIAGGTWAVSMAAVRSDTGKDVGPEGTIACKATEGAKKLAVVSHAFVSAGGGGGSSAACIFRVPKTPKHAAVHAAVTVTDAGQSATASFSTKTK